MKLKMCAFYFTPLYTCLPDQQRATDTGALSNLRDSNYLYWRKERYIIFQMKLNSAFTFAACVAKCISLKVFTLLCSDTKCTDGIFDKNTKLKKA